MIKKEDLITYATDAAKLAQRRTAKLKKELTTAEGVPFAIAELDNFTTAIEKLLSGAAFLEKLEPGDEPAEEFLYEMDQQIDLVQSFEGMEQPKTRRKAPAITGAAPSDYRR